MQADPLEKRLVFFAGKGGVGRTTLSAAIALNHARRGMRTLIVELGATEQVPALFGRTASSGYTPTKIHPDLQLFSCHLTPRTALKEYGVMKLKVKKLYRIVFENDVMKRMLEWVPGMDQLLMIGKIWHLEQEKLKDGSPAYERIIIDAPATGHGISLLQLPSVILQQVKTGPFARDTRPIREMLEDSDRTVVNLVSLAEELPTRESLDLAARVTNELNIKIGQCFVNRVWPKPFTEIEENVFTEMQSALKGKSSQIDQLLNRVDGAVLRQKNQAKYVRQLQDGLKGVPVIEIPYLFTDTIGPEELDTLSQHMSN
jgi:anion-transporting  ArsA/GET3 family ATPase